MNASLTADRERNEKLYAEALDRWDLHGVVNPLVPLPIADVIREGVPPAPMLLDDWLYRGELHWFYAEAESWKTWVALILALRVMGRGEKVVWFDEELGQQVIARRLIALGAAPDLIEQRFGYFEFPGLTPQDAERHRASLDAMKPALVVYDTATDMLTAAGADENSGRDVTAWVKAFPEQARQLGITQIVCDHTAKGGETAVGSRAKRAKAKVQYYFVSEARGDEQTTGRLRVTLTKNTPGNALPQERIFRIGGDGEGNFVFELSETRAASTRAARKQGKRAAVREEIEALLREHGTLNQSQIVSHIDASQGVVIEVVKSMAELPQASGVEATPDGRSIRYTWIGKALDGEPDIIEEIEDD